MLNITIGTNSKPVSTSLFVDTIKQLGGINGELYTGYPIFSTPEGRFPIDAILISPKKGVILFHIIEGKSLLEDTISIQDDLYNKFEAKARNSKSLMDGRTLNLKINIITFAPAVPESNYEFDSNYPICNQHNLNEYILNLPDNANFTKYNELISVIQSISTIRKGLKNRFIEKHNSRGAKLKELEDSIATLDNAQSRAVVETVDKVQRIRGLAGSGKTIVLALKAAYLHSQHPDWKIAVTFHTQSLKGQFRKLINTFTIEATGEEPDWDNLKIIHSWGSGEGRKEGIYYNYCMSHNIEYLDYGTAKNRFGFEKSFDYACIEALNNTKEFCTLYDAIIIDEAQDFPISFLQMCYKILPNQKRLVYAYDELQSLNSRHMPSAEKIFGEDKNGIPFVKLEDPSQDIILEKCYRNSKPVLTTAHALGFGIYRDIDENTGTGLIQMFDDSRLWEDIGYKVISGELKDNTDVTLSRTEDSSPRFLSDHSDIDDLITFIKFHSLEEQDEWLASEIFKNLNDDELRTDDIIVINTDPIKTRSSVGSPRTALLKYGINSILAGVDTSPDVFYDADINCITFTGIHRAKGNEAGMVYIINAQDCFNSLGSLPTVRNRLFTAITRSKAWVRVLGVGEDMEKLIREFNRVKDNDFNLSFKYPDDELRKKLNIVNREMTDKQKASKKKANSNLEQLFKDIDKGNLLLDDIDKDKVQKIKSLFSDEN